MKRARLEGARSAAWLLAALLAALSLIGCGSGESASDGDDTFELPDTDLDSQDGDLGEDDGAYRETDLSESTAPSGKGHAGDPFMHGAQGRSAPLSGTGSMSDVDLRNDLTGCAFQSAALGAKGCGPGKGREVVVKIRLLAGEALRIEWKAAESDTLVYVQSDARDDSRAFATLVDRQGVGGTETLVFTPAYDAFYYVILDTTSLASILRYDYTLTLGKRGDWPEETDGDLDADAETTEEESEAEAENADGDDAEADMEESAEAEVESEEEALTDETLVIVGTHDLSTLLQDIPNDFAFVGSGDVRQVVFTSDTAVTSLTFDINHFTDAVTTTAHAGELLRGVAPGPAPDFTLALLDMQGRRIAPTTQGTAWLPATFGTEGGALARRGEDYWAVDKLARKLFRFSHYNGAWQTAAAFSYPDAYSLSGLAVGPDDQLYLLQQERNQSLILRVDAADGHVSRRYLLLTAVLSGIAYDAASGSLWGLVVDGTTFVVRFQSLQVW